MIDAAHLSAKLPAMSATGFALWQSTEPRYECDWHRLDCAMLLWPQSGGLRVWCGDDGVPAASAVQLARNTAILLPPGSAHRTRSTTALQRHAELYLPAEALRRCRRFGAFQLDGSTAAMLAALAAPSLRPEPALLLVQAVVAQLSASPLLDSDVGRLPPGRRLLQRFEEALAADATLPSIDKAAAELGVSIRQLQRACLQEFGATPVELRRRTVAAHARRLLAHGQTLAQTSLQLGFASSGHLSRLLRAVSG